MKPFRVQLSTIVYVTVEVTDTIGEYAGQHALAVAVGRNQPNTEKLQSGFPQMCGDCRANFVVSRDSWQIDEVEEIIDKESE